MLSSRATLTSTSTCVCGPPWRPSCSSAESLATECTEAETALALQGLGSYPVLQSGSDDQVRRWLPAVASGAAVAAFALSYLLPRQARMEEF